MVSHKRKNNESGIGGKIKTLRLKTGITQENLATLSKVPYTTIIKVESGAIQNPSIKVISAIAKTLQVPVEQIVEGSDIVKTIQGKDCVSEVLDDVFTTLKDSGGEVFISGVDERKFVDIDIKKISSHLKRLNQAGIKERLLSREGDAFFFPGNQSVYRWVPENLFNPTPIYVYGEKVAMIVWGPPQQVIFIRNAALADAYRKQFLFIWKHAQVPPTQQISEDERGRLEQTIIKRFGGKVSYITSKDKKLFRDILGKEKTDTYGNSFYYMCQASNGLGADKLGLKFYDGEMLASIGIFNRSSLGGGWHFHIIHPTGKVELKKILALSKTMLELSGNPVFIKKVSTTKQEELLNSGFSSIENYPWHSQAMEEDDTFPEQVLDIDETLRTIEGLNKKNVRQQYRGFVSKYGKEIHEEELSESNMKDADKIIEKFFDYLDIKKLHISAPTDYDNILHHPPLGVNGKQYFSKILYLKNQPIAFFAAESISNDTAGLYANITMHQEIPYLSEYFIVHICTLLKTAGFKYLNLGGSETSGLFQFKDKFSPVKYNKMHWLVYKF